LPIHTDMSVAVIELYEDRFWPVKELAEHTVLRILRRDVKVLKVATMWVPQLLNKVQRWT
jgi:hypothetical protein